MKGFLSENAHEKPTGNSGIGAIWPIFSNNNLHSYLQPWISSNTTYLRMILTDLPSMAPLKFLAKSVRQWDEIYSHLVFQFDLYFYWSCEYYWLIGLTSQHVYDNYFFRTTWFIKIYYN